MKVASWVWPFGRKQKALVNANNDRSWTTIFDWYPGAWQQNAAYETTEVRAFYAVFACITLIASDIGKLRMRLVEKQNDIWREVSGTPFSPVLQKPNRYQNHIQFKEWWITSKLSNGNAYALKQRDRRGIVTALYLLDPNNVTPLVSESGDVFYRIQRDNLSAVENEIVIPAREIIHDRMNCLYHPLIGLSPLYASGAAATKGLRMQNNSSRFFGNMSRPSGLLTAPGSIGDETAERLKTSWNTNYGGENFGKVAVLGDGLKFEPMGVTAVDAQLVEQIKLTAEEICSTFHVPAFKIGAGTIPAGQKVEDLNQIYYSDCLQSLIESFEVCMDEGLELDTPTNNGRQLGVELDLNALLRMDKATQTDVLVKQVGGGIIAPDEARAVLDMFPVKGGATPYLQQQNYSLAALDERDRNDPFAKAPPPSTSPAPDAEAMTDEEMDSEMEMAA